MTPESIESLGNLPLLANLTIRLQLHQLTPALASALRGLRLQSLKLQFTLYYKEFDAEFADSKLMLLEGLPISTQSLENMGISDSGLSAMRGLPITDLDLCHNPLISNAGLLAGILHMPLTKLKLGY